MKTRFTVFLIEDDDSLRLVLKHLLEYEGFLVFDAENGIEAIEKLNVFKDVSIPDLILTDIQMPHNGKNLIDTLRTKPELGGIPIVPMSAGGFSEISGKKVLAKPLDLHNLIETIRTTIKQDRDFRHLD